MTKTGRGPDDNDKAERDPRRPKERESGRTRLQITKDRLLRKLKRDDQNIYPLY
jgi:hypothetical protein